MDKTTTVDKLKTFLLELFFPYFCLGCNREENLLCQDCKSILDISEYDYCLCNKNPKRLPLAQKNNGKPFNFAQGKCNKCSDKKLSGLYFALPYKEKLLTKKLIRQFKYQPYIKNLAKTLALLIAEHLILSGKNIEEIWENSILIPVPLDNKKLKFRGYNQSEELAKELSKILNVPLFSDILIKTKPTKPQMELKKEERERNLKGVFAIKKPFGAAQDLWPFNKILGKKIFLVDDVYTTGSTMEECSKVLKQAGAKSVWGITIAREE